MAQPSALNDDNLLILELRLGRYLLSEAFAGYLNNASVLLPLGEMMEAFDFAISTNADARTAQGWFLRENRLFSLDINNGRVIIDGKPGEFIPRQISVFEGEIFVDVRLLAKWFPLDIEFELSNLRVTIESREPLPIEQRLARDKKRKQLLRDRASGPKYGSIPVPYKNLGWPITDTSMEVDFKKSGDGNNNATLRQTTFITGDIGKLSGELFLAGNDDESLSQARLKFSRVDLDGNLLGKAKATSFEFGDVFTPQVPLVSSTILGRGAAVTNFPLDQPSEFDRITLNGDLPVGWEVELYRNETLLDFRVDRADGRYVFEDVPLLFGVNILRLSFFGPQGQSREEIRQIRVGTDQIKPGQHRYRVAVNQHETQLLLGNVEENESDLQERLRGFLEYETGITKNVSVAANLSSIPFEGGHKNYLGGSARMAIGPVFLRNDLVRNLSEGWANKVAAQTSAFGMNFIVEHDRFFDFVSEQFSTTDDPTEHGTDVRIDGVLNLANLARLPFSLNGSHDQQRSGDTSTSLNGRLSATLGQTTVTNTLSYALDKGETSRSTTLGGSFLVGGRIKDVRVRGALGYDVRPEPKLSNSTLSGNWNINEQYSASGGLSLDLGGETTQATISSGLNTNLKFFALGLNMDYSTEKEFNAKLSMSFSSARDPRTGRTQMRAQHKADGGAMSARIFLDVNQNGVYDGDDEPLEGVKFTVAGRETKEMSDKNGIIFITGIDVYEPVDFGVSLGTLEDPFWLPRPEGVNVVLRPGVTGRIDFPVVATGEIDGTVYKKTKEWADEVSDVVIQLVDSNDNVVRTVKSSFDGFFLFDFVLPGKYTLRVDPEQIARLKLEAPEEQHVEIGSDGTILNGQDFVLYSTRQKKSERRFRVLLTSFKTRQLAEEEWAALAKELPDATKGLKPMTQNEDLGGDIGVVHNLYAGPFTDRNKARRLCVNIRNLRGEVWCNPLTIQVR